MISAGEIPPERILEIRMTYGLTLEEFGKRLGVSPGTVSLWERGMVVPSRRHCSAICRIWPEEGTANEDR